VAGRPVKWIETRRENLAAASQAREGAGGDRGGRRPDGVLLGLRARVVADNGAYHIHPLTAALEPPGTAAILPGPYRTPAYAWEALAVPPTSRPSAPIAAWA
jgi:Aerobic-type carbon monoxide dehydrogenase, large subunit CoxL/CutL homologs